jgi:hypothetical protein
MNLMMTYQKVLGKTMQWIILLAALLISGCWSYVSKDAQESFERRRLPLNLTVYPVNVIKGTAFDHDRELARRVADYLETENLATPVVGNINHWYPFQWGMNQAKMSGRSAKAFAAQVKKDGIQTDYALLVEILCNASETNVVGVEYYLVEKSGRIVNGCLSNSDWPDFKEIKPTDRKGGYEIAIRLLKRNWQVR